MIELLFCVAFIVLIRVTIKIYRPNKNLGFPVSRKKREKAKKEGRK